MFVICIRSHPLHKDYTLRRDTKLQRRVNIDATIGSVFELPISFFKTRCMMVATSNWNTTYKCNKNMALRAVATANQQFSATAMHSNTKRGWLDVEHQKQYRSQTYKGMNNISSKNVCSLLLHMEFKRAPLPDISMESLLCRPLLVDISCMWGDTTIGNICHMISVLHQAWHLLWSKFE